MSAVADTHARPTTMSRFLRITASGNMKSDISHFSDVPLIVGRAMAVGLRNPELGTEQRQPGLGSEISKALSDPTRDEHTECQTTSKRPSMPSSSSDSLSSLATQGTRALDDPTRDEHFENEGAPIALLGTLITDATGDPTRDVHVESECDPRIAMNSLGSITTLSIKDSTCDEPTWDS